MDALTSRAIAAAVEIAGREGLKNLRPEVLKDGANALIHLKPAPVVARVATTSGLVRQPAEVWLQRDVSIATYLHSVGAPVIAPSDELPPGPHVWEPAGEPEGGQRLALSFWNFVVHEREPEVPANEAIASLRELHAALRQYPGSLPYMGVVLDEIPHWLKWLEIRHAVSGQDMLAFREAHWRLAAQLGPTHVNTQPLHGDAHRRNLLRTPDGLLWTDFEDTCKGPIAWDLATFLHQEPGREEDLFEQYTDGPAWSDLQPYFLARDLEAVVYMQVLASRFPGRAPEAARRLEAWHRRRFW